MGASESKLTFKESVFRLREANIPPGSPWWNQFYQLPETADDVFSLWSPTDLRDLTGTRNQWSAEPSGGYPAQQQSSPPANLETLIYTMVARLEELQTKRVFSDPHQLITREALNCMRILTRLIPYVYEAEQLSAWQERFFWQPRKPQAQATSGAGNSVEYFDGLVPGKKISEDDKDTVLGPPLGEQLLDILVKYLFFPNFTIPKRLDDKGFPDLKVQYHIWDSGVGCRQRIGMTKENERNAAEVLRLLLALCSKQMFLSPGVVADREVEPLSYLTTKLDKQVVLSIICSLLNVVIKYNPASWKLPVDAYLGVDSKQLLVSSSIHLLLVLVLYPAPDGDANAFRKALGRLHRVEDFQFIQQGLATTLTQPVSGVASYLPAGQKAIPWTIETLVLFWELVQLNKRFRAFIIDTERAHDFVILILYYAMDAKDDPSKQGIVRMCILILQTLSIEQSFGTRLNKPFVGQETLPSVMRIPQFRGSYADFLIMTLHSLMLTTKDKLESIYSAILAIMHNIAAYTRELGRPACLMLLELFVKFSSPYELLTKSGQHELLFSVLETINALLEHQYEANQRFVVVLMQNKERFWALRDFTTEKAIALLDRLAQERKERNLGDQGGIRSPVRGTSIDSLRSPASARSTHLGNVPENSAFSIGDDEEDNESITDSHAGLSTPQSATASVFEDAVPAQQRSMSEKARGKQPIGQGSFSRSTSHNTSTTSLPATNTSTSFVPNADWLATWLPYLPLHTILTTIDHVSRRAATRAGQADDAAPSSPDTSAFLKPTAEHANSWARVDQTHTTPAELPIATGHQRDWTSRGPERRDSQHEPIKVQAFQWTSFALGWYISLLWGYIYASDMATNKGTNGIWTGTSIKLFNILSHRSEVSLRSPRGAVDAVGDNIARRISSISLSSAKTPTMREI